MKTAQQIIGLPVVSIFDGNEIGKVKNVIINASKGTIDFFIIDSGIRSLAGGVIPADRVLGIGEYALTIQQPDDISDIVKIPAAIELMQKNITVTGTRVLTKKGSLLGEAGDIYFNDEESSYNIIGVEFVPAKSTTPSGIIPRSSIITFGKNLLVVQDDFVEKLLESPSAIEEVTEDEKKNYNSEPDIAVSQEPAAVEVPPVPVEELKDALFRIETMDPVQAEEPAEADLNLLPEEPELSQPAEDASMSAAELFEHRQRQFLVGKKVTKTIHDASGNVLVNAGDIITEDLIQLVKENGKLIDLVMNYEE